MRMRWLAVCLVVPAVLVACVGDAAIVPNNPDSSLGSDAPINNTEGGADVPNLPDAGWSPATLDNANQLALWLDGANVTIANGKVGAWPDQSKNKNNASNAQGGPAQDPGVANNHDAVHFMNTALTIKDSQTLQFGIGQFYMATVVKVTATPAYFFSKPKTMPGGGGTTYVSGLEFLATTVGIKDDAGMPFQSRSASAHIDAQGGNLVAWTDPIFNDAKFHYVALRRVNANTLQLEVDDQAPRSNTMTGAFDISQPSVDIAIGEVVYGNIAQIADFDMAELIVIHGSGGVVSDNDATSLHAYLKKKYAL